MSDLDFIHRYLPGESDRVLLLLHGTGGNENDLLSLGREIDPAAALLSPRGKVLENGAPRFFRRLAEGVFDEEDVVRRASELADFILAAADEYKFAPAQLIAVGYSNGANVASAMMLLRPATINVAILLRAMVPLTKPPSADLRGKRILISNGQEDSIVPLENTRSLASLLRNNGADLTLAWQAAGHGLVSADLATARQWLATQTMPSPST